MQEARCYTQLLTPAGTAVYMYCCPAMLGVCNPPHTHTRTHRHPGRSPRDMCPVLSGPACHTVSVMWCVSHSHYTHTLLVVLPPPWVQTILHASPCGCRRGRKGGDLGLWWESLEGAAVLWASLAHRYTGTQHCHHSVFSLSPSPTHLITILSTMTASVRIRKLAGK